MKKVIILAVALVAILGIFSSCKKECKPEETPKQRTTCVAQAPDWYNPPAGSFKVVIVDKVTLIFHHYFGWHEQILYYGCPPVVLYDGGMSNQLRDQVLQKIDRDGYAVLVEVVNPQYSGQMQLSNE
jgi:hypothetical protein